MKKILIVDDEKDLCFFLKTNLEAAGEYNVITATEGKAGIHAARHHLPDLILLDVMMPGMDGLEVLKRLKEDEKTMSIPVVMLTGVGDDEARLKALGYFNEDYIVKPVTLSFLKSRIRDILMKKR